MKIGFLLGNLQGNGGIARVVSIITNELCKEHDVHILSFCPALEIAGYEYDQRIICTRLFDDRISMTSAILHQHAVSKVKSYIAKNNIDMLVACGELYFPLAIISAFHTNTKCYCWEHSDPAGTSDHKFQMFSRKFAVKFADKIIVLTKAAQMFYEGTLNCNKKKIVQIYNPVGKAVAQSKRYNSGSKKILSVGRLTYQKNFQLLVQIAAEVLPKYEDWTWEICGEGEDRTELERLIRDNNLEGKLILRGQVRDLHSKYQEYSFMVMTSRYEGFPMSLIEAEANRLPLISFDIPTGPSEIIHDGENGFLIPNQESHKMINKISTLIENTELRESMSKKAFMAAQEFELDLIMIKWKHMITSL